MWPNSQTQNLTKFKEKNQILPNSNVTKLKMRQKILKNQNMTQIKNSKCDQTQNLAKLKVWQLKILKCDGTQKPNRWQDCKTQKVKKKKIKNSKCGKTLKHKTVTKLKMWQS